MRHVSGSGGRFVKRLPNPLLCPLCVLFIFCLHNTADAQSDTAPYKLTEIFRVGDEARGDTILFKNHRYAEIAVNSLNQLFVGGFNEVPIMAFSDGGDFIGFVGSEGKGPGEFQSSTSVLVGPQDSIYVFDANSDLLSVYEPETLQFAYSLSLANPESPSSPSRLLGVSRKGILFRYTPRFRPPGNPLGGYDPGESRSDVVYLIDRQSSVAVASMAKLPAKEHVVRASSNEESSSISVMSLPFGREPFFVFHDGLLYAGWNDAIDISIISENGGTVRTIRMEREAVPVTRKEVESMVSSRSRRDRRDILRSKLLPETKPAYDAIIVDDQGHIWIREYPNTEAEFAKWLIVDPNGRLVGQMELSTNLLLKVIKGGRAYGSFYSNNSGPYIVVYSITR